MTNTLKLYSPVVGAEVVMSDFVGADGYKRTPQLDLELNKTFYGDPYSIGNVHKVGRFDWQISVALDDFNFYNLLCLKSRQVNLYKFNLESELVLADTCDRVVDRVNRTVAPAPDNVTYTIGDCRAYFGLFLVAIKSVEVAQKLRHVRLVNLSLTEIGQEGDIA